MPFGPWPGGASGDSAAAAQAAALLAIVPGMQFSRVKPNDREPSTNAATPTILATDGNQLGGGTFPAAGNYVTVTGTSGRITSQAGWS